MPNFSATSDPASSLQPPDSHGTKTADQRNGSLSVEMQKRFIQLESEAEFLKEDNGTLRATILELEDKRGDDRRQIEDMDELIRKKDGDMKSLAGKLTMSEENCDKWKDKYETLREGSDSGERKWRARLEESKMKCRQLEVDIKKLEMDLSRDTTGELTEKLKAADVTNSELIKKIQKLEQEKEAFKSEMMRKFQKLEQEKDASNSETTKMIDDLKRENMRIKEVLGQRVLKLEESIEEWKQITSGGIGNSKPSGPKSTGTPSLIDPKTENMEADEPLTEPVIVKKQDTPKAAVFHIVEISDDEEEEENQQTPSFASPSRADCPPAAKRKLEEKQDGAIKRCKSNGPTNGKQWKDAKQMLEALKSSDELCVKSICALYRKHKSLGVWKNQSDGNEGFKKPICERGVALGKFLTDGDPEGRMKKSVADLVRFDPKSGLFHCQFIAKEHHERLFEMYINNQDPFFLP